MRSTIIRGFLCAMLALAAAAEAAPLPTGACCNDPQGCCPPDGSCFETTSDQCFVGFQGDNTTCAGQCPVTTTTLPVGACCKPDGDCTEETAVDCVVGIFQGGGTFCASVECPQPTTTSTSSTFFPSSTSSTTLGTVVCGDANNDLDVTSTDALIALRTAVGLQSCPLIRCDFNGTGLVTAPDALGILKFAVGQIVVPMCPVPLTP